MALNSTPHASLYVGIEIEVNHSPCRARFCVNFHDGFCGIETIIEDLADFKFNLKQSFNQKFQAIYDEFIKPFEEPVVECLKDFMRHPPLSKIQIAGIGIMFDGRRFCIDCGEVKITGCKAIPLTVMRAELFTRLWLELDILPVIVCTDIRGSIDERACSSVRKVVRLLGAYDIPRPNIGFMHEVDVDWSSQMRLANTNDYKPLADPHTWSLLESNVAKFQKKRLYVSFFSSTPLGGGVAIMRHALLRFFRLFTLDAHWFVTKPKPDVFNITKYKFHNVLQGVSSVDVKLSSGDKAIYESWCQSNIEQGWQVGPFKLSNVIVIDDPQLIGIIPCIKATNPSCKIIFRCHIHLRKDLIDAGENETANVWDYLWGFMKDSVDLFIFHPMTEDSIPNCVPRAKIRYFPAFVDQLDGLSKHISEENTDHYMNLFARLVHDSTGRRLTYPTRPYITQISRFDPSKGIEDVIKAYQLLRRKIDCVLPFTKIPQLVITGISAVDDPQGNSFLQELQQKLKEYEDIATDVIMFISPPSDQLLNVILGSSEIYLQLSVREGFEIKVTEALMHGKPVVAYSTGGIVMQVQNGVNGFLVSPGDIEQVASHLEKLLVDVDEMEKVKRNILGFRIGDLDIVSQSNKWLDCITNLA